MDFGLPVQKRAPTARDRRRKVLIKKVSITLVSFLVVFGIFSYVMNLSPLRVEKVVIFGTNIVSESEVSEVVNTLISGKYFFLIPKNNVFFYPKERLGNDLLSKFSRIEAVYPALDRGNILVVTVAERSPKYVWCGKENRRDTSTHEECYFMDKDGYIFIKSPDFSPNVFFRIYGELASTTEPIGARVFSLDEFTRIMDFRSAVSSIGFSPKAVVSLKDGDYEFILNNGGKILFNTKNDFAKSADNIRLAVTSAPLFDELKTKPNKLLYIDVRFGNKVFYKFED